MRARAVSTELPASARSSTPISIRTARTRATLDDALELLAHDWLLARPRGDRHGVPSVGAATRDSDAATVRGFYEYQSRSWSRGTDRRRWSSPTAASVGAALDRNGLRPARYSVTEDGLVACLAPKRASIRSERSRASWRGAGSVLVDMLFVDPERRRGPQQRDRRNRLGGTAKPYAGMGRRRLQYRAARGPAASPLEPTARRPDRRRQAADGYTKEELKPMVLKSPWPPRGTSRPSRWATTHPCRRSAGALARSINYVKQRFAQVTNPPIDPLRERLVMSLRIVASARSPRCSSEQPDVPACWRSTRSSSSPPPSPRCCDRDATRSPPSVLESPPVSPPRRRRGAEAAGAIWRRERSQPLRRGARRSHHRRPSGRAARRSPYRVPLACGAVHHRFVQRSGLAVTTERRRGERRRPRRARHRGAPGYGADAICPRSSRSRPSPPMPTRVRARTW